MSENKVTAQKIMEQLSDFSTANQVEILANVLMFLGVSGMEIPGDNINPRNIAQIVLKDRESNGETIANALAMQGITMMLWLEQ